MKTMLLKIIFCGLITAPVVVMPMEENSAAQEQRGCPLCYDDKPINEFRELTCGHNGICVHCLRDDLREVLDVDDLQENLRQHLRCITCRREARVAEAAGAQAREVPLMQPGDIRMIYEGDQDPAHIFNPQERVDRFNQVVRHLNLARENIQNEAAFNRFLAENPNARRCPTAGCQWAYIVEANQRPENVRCDVCRQQFCSHCRGAHRVGDRCRRPEEVAVANNNNGGPISPEELANREWARRNIKACPACRQNVNRIDGCNYMRCVCGHEFCWMCLVPDPGHRHMRCLPEDLARAQQLYGDGAGVPCTAQDPFGQNRAPARIAPIAPRIGIPGLGIPFNAPYAPAVRVNDRLHINVPPLREPGRPWVHPGDDNGGYGWQNDPNYGYEPAAQPAPLPQFRRNDPPLIIPFLCVVGGCAALGVCAYKIYKYLSEPPFVITDLKTSIENLHKEAIKSRAQMVSATGYFPASFKNYFDLQIIQFAYKDLDEAQLKILAHIVSDLEAGLVVGNCDKQYNALVHFIIALEIQESSKEPVVEASPAKEVAVKTTVPAAESVVTVSATAKQVKKAVASRMHKKHKSRKTK